MGRRVVVTGLGAVTPVGNDCPSTWRSLVAGRSGVARITRFDPTPFQHTIQGEVKNFDPTSVIQPKPLKHMDRNVQFAVVAAQEAVQDASLEIAEVVLDIYVLAKFAGPASRPKLTRCMRW